MKIGRLFFAGAATLFVAGCGGKDGPTTPPGVASVTVTAPATQIEVASTLLLTASTRDAKGAVLTGRTVTWSSSAQTVASVDASGIVTGVSAGAATITAASEGVSGSVQLTVVPIPVIAVLIAQRTPAVRQGEATQLTAIAQDAIGRPLNDRTITWTSANSAIATVSSSGRATGVSSGSVFIVASSEGKRDSVTLRVRSLNAPTLGATSPLTWTPGLATATIAGTNFSAVLSENEVYLNGVRANVTSASPTSLRITVPSAASLPCSATGPVPLVVVVNGDSAAGTAGLRVATQRQLGVGQSLFLTTTADVECNEFSVTGGKYLVTAFNYANNADIRQSFQMLGASISTAAVQSSVAMLPPAAAPSVGPLRDQARDASGFARAHALVLEENLQRLRDHPNMLGTLRDRRARARQGGNGPALGVSDVARAAFGATTQARSVPVPPPNVGDKIWRRMRREFSNSNTFDSVRVRVVYVGPKLIIAEDTTNELAGTMDNEFQQVGTEFDRDMYGFLSSFGDPVGLDSLLDNNGRVVAIFSKRVNEYTVGAGSLLGFVTSCDYAPRTDPVPGNACASSNEGEYFYAFVPNPNGVRGKYSLDTWKRLARGTMIHEMKHVVMFTERIKLDADFGEEGWLEEATAQQASELWARKVYGKTQRGDIKWSDGPRCDYASASAACSDPVEGIGHHMQFLYQHYNASETKSPIESRDAVIYGSGWSLARWATDQYDGGNEANFLRSLTQQRDDRGITNLRNRTGKEWSELIGYWSMASVADNYPGATVTDPRLRLPSWDTRDVFAGMSANLVFRNADGTTTPAFPRPWPLNVRTSAFGNFPDFVRTVTSLKGGGFVAWEISGTQTAPQVLALRSLSGGVPPAQVGMMVLRVQ